MEHVDGRLIFSATDLINHLECPHLTHLNIEVALGRVEIERSRSDTTDLVARKGDEHERNYLAQLIEGGREVVEIGGVPANGIENEPRIDGAARDLSAARDLGDLGGTRARARGIRSRR